MVPKLPGSLISSRATINDESSTGLGSGILKSANAVLGVLRELIFLSSASDIKVFSQSKIASVVKS
jgi:hypothetical protein